MVKNNKKKKNLKKNGLDVLFFLLNSHCVPTAMDTEAFRQFLRGLAANPSPGPPGRNTLEISPGLEIVLSSY